MAYFIVKLTPIEENEMLLGSNPMAIEPLAASHLALVWELYVDGSSNDQGCGASLILTSSKPERLRIEYAPRLGFKAFNNEAKYEPLLVGANGGS